MSINNILEDIKIELLIESGIRIPKNTKSAKILHHDDFDGVMSAIAIGLQLKKQGITDITTDILHDRDDEYDQEVKLAKRKNQMLVVVDFDRFKNRKLSNKQIDAQTDHHEKADDAGENTSAKKVGIKGSRNYKMVDGKKVEWKGEEYGSDVKHISTAVAHGFLTGSDIKIMNGIDSAKFGKNVSTNVFLQKELKKNDGVQNKKMRLAIITSSILGQLVRSKASVNPGAVKSIIKNVIKSPTVIKLYSETKKHIKLQKEQVDLLKAYEGKKNGEIDWDAIKEFNKKAPMEMKIGTARSGELKKSPDTGRKSAASEEELGKRNKEKQFARDIKIDPKTGKKELRSTIGDAELKKWELDKKFSTPVPKNISKDWWGAAELILQKKGIYRPANNKKGSPYNKKLFAEVKKLEKNYIKSHPEYAPNSPGILKKTENVSVQTDFKGNRYLAYEDPKIAANIRDFWKFWQMAMRPDYYDKFKAAAKAKGKDFNPEEIDLVDLGKKSLNMAKKEMFTIEELKKRGFENPAGALKLLNKAYPSVLEKSGGHKSITNIGLDPIYKITADKYADALKKAKKLKDGKIVKADPALMKRIEDMEATMDKKKKEFSYFLGDFKKRVQDLLTQAVQGRVNRTKAALTQTLKNEELIESIINNSKL